jgi:NADP-dependent 3-hydroxy acid dehydrogenase YdfG
MSEPTVIQERPVESKLAGTVALVTGASSGIGAATARRLAEHGASVALAARRGDRLEALAAEIDGSGGRALVLETDITDRAQAEAAVQRTIDGFGRLDTLVNNAGLMLLGPVVGADPEEWDRMIAVNVQGLLYTTRAALPHLLQAAEEGPRGVADIVNVSSIAGRVAWDGFGVYNLTKLGVNGFTESLRQEITRRHCASESSSRVAWRPSWARTTNPKFATTSSILSMSKRRSSARTTSPTASRSWSLDRATRPLPSYGSCRPIRSERVTYPLPARTVFLGSLHFRRSLEWQEERHRP